MKKLLLLGALLSGGLFCLQDVSVGHGGTYRGPGDTVPPGGGGGGGGGGGPSTPGPSGPGTPGPAGPSTPGPASPGAPGGAPGGNTPTTGGQRDAGVDLLVWDFWWEFNKDPYLNLKSKIHDGGTLTGSDDFFLGHGEKVQAKDSLRPSEAVIRSTVVPALKKALETERSNDILTGALIALAKIGDVADESGESEFQKIIAEFLKDGNQEVAETAAVALGILADNRSVPILVDLFKDTPVARKFLGKTEVPVRTRAFAAYGLGLIGFRTNDNAVRQDIAEHLIDVLNSPNFSRRDIKVAAMTALGLTPVDIVSEESSDAEGDESNRRHVLSRQAQLAFLLDYFDEANQRANKSTRHWYVRAHAPIAMSRLLKDTGAEFDEVRKSVSAQLMESIGKHSKARDELQMSSVVALGQIGRASNGELDEGIRKELVRMIKDGDQQSRRFALIAMAQSGGAPGEGEGALEGTADVRKELLKQLSKGKTQMKPWAALAIGVLGRQLLDNDAPVDSTAAMALRTATAENRRPSDIGAYLVGLGIRRDTEAKDIVLEKLEYFQGSDSARGYAAVSLGLMEDRSAIEPIQGVIKNSKYKPELLKQAAIGLGLLGDKELVTDLIKMLEEAPGLATQAAISSALGAIGDSRSIDPLVGMLGNTQLTDTARGFAAVALGIVCDKEDLPWNSKIAVNINYRANTTTLTGENGTGILDIL
ncbi:MAG: HEAT repeat domain-containing protein [bacterium]|nr:HEAT repeat domain-containing protein [bacterium]